MRFADIDAVTLDAYGTLVSLRNPVDALQAALLERGVERDARAVAAAFAAEVVYYRGHAVEGGDEARLEDLRRRCSGVFLSGLDAELDDAEFAPAFVASIAFDVLPEVDRVLTGLRARGLELAVVSNWDSGLEEQLERVGLTCHLSAVVSSAEVGAEKPDPAIFAATLGKLGIEPARALHVGDSAEDEDGARAAGLRFVHVPLATALEGWS